jgi:hypothetical protein
MSYGPYSCSRYGGASGPCRVCVSWIHGKAAVHRSNLLAQIDAGRKDATEGQYCADTAKTRLEIQTSPRSRKGEACPPPAPTLSFELRFELHKKEKTIYTSLPFSGVPSPL